MKTAPYGKRWVKAGAKIKPSTKFQKETKVDIAQDKRLTKIEKMIKKEKPEHKYVDIDSGSSTFYAYYALEVAHLYGLVNLTGYNIVKGIDYNQRIGDEIKPVSFHLRLEYTAGNTANNKLRVIIFQSDAQFEYTAGVPAEQQEEQYKILKYCETAPYMLTSPYARDLQFPFKVLYDQTRVLNSNSPNGVFNIRIGGLKKKQMSKMEWGNISGSGGPVYLPTKKQLYMLVIDNDTTNTLANHVNYKFNGRLTYIDS